MKFYSYLLITLLLAKTAIATPIGGSGSANGEIISGAVAINKTTAASNKLEVVDAINPQMRLTNIPGIDYATFDVDSSGDLSISPSGGNVIVPGADFSFSGATIINNLKIRYAPGNETTLQQSANGYLTFSKATSLRGLINDSETVNLLDDATVVIADAAPGESGYGEIQAADGLSYAKFVFDSSGNIFIVNGWNVRTTDADGYLCIYNDSGSITVKNRLGATYFVHINVHGSASSGGTTINNRIGTYFDLVNDTFEVGDIPGGNKATIGNDGDLIFEGTSGLPYADLYTYDNATTTSFGDTGKANKSQVTVFSVNGHANDLVPDHTNDHITITSAGKYKADISITVESTVAVASTIALSLWINNGATEFQNIHVHRRLSGTEDAGSLGMSGIIDVAANDTVEVWVWNETNTNAVLISDINLSLIQVGG